MEMSIHVPTFPLKAPCYIYGYGSETLYGQPTLDLRIAQVQTTPIELCIAKLGEYNAPKRSEGLYCAHGANPNIDACGVSLFMFFPYVRASIRLNKTK